MIGADHAREVKPVRRNAPEPTAACQRFRSEDRSPECAVMETHKLALPLLAFAGGAILGRLFGLKTLVRGAMTAAAVTGLTSRPALLGPNTHRATNAAHRRRPARSAHRRSSAKRSSSA
jgi:hypothetical protein